MFVKAGHNLQAAGGMMDLVQCSPEKLRFVAVAMPPIINKRGKKIKNECRSPVPATVFQMKKRMTICPSIPCLPREHGDAKLDRIDQDDSAPPALNAGQFHGRPQAFGENTTCGDRKNDQDARSRSSPGPIKLS